MGKTIMYGDINMINIQYMMSLCDFFFFLIFNRFSISISIDVSILITVEW